MKRIKLPQDTVDKIKALLQGYTSYKRFSASRKAAFEFVRLVGIRVCPYCNINYTYTVFQENGDLVVRCDIDHFVAQTHDATLSLQYDNLIPSCQQCNSRLKSQQIFDKVTHLHPYEDSFDDIKVFRLSIISPHYLDDDGFKIIFVKRSSADARDDARADAMIDAFRLEERYAMHKQEAVAFLKKVKFYHALRKLEIESLTGTLGPANHILFGAEISDINSSSLGKLKKDLYEHYKA